MSGIQGHILGHLAKRGYEAAQQHVRGPNPEWVAQKLQHDPPQYDPQLEVSAGEMMPLIITGILTFLLVASIRYTIGEVMASLAMIEAPTATLVIESHDKPPAYADEPDAPIEKEPLMPSEAAADTEVALINNKPITSSIRATSQHLYKIGGFRAKWRGARMSAIYHFLHSLIVNFSAGLAGYGLFGNALMYIVASLALAPLHAVWTHSMIGSPSNKPFFRRFPKQGLVLLLPSLVFAIAQQATIVLPVMVAFALGLPEINHSHVMDAAANDGSQLIWIFLRFLAVPATALFVSLAVLLPATVTLTRIEAALLPEDQDTIVPFDRQAIVGDLDITAKGTSRPLFVQAWKSFDSSSRRRLVKLYLKLVSIVFALIYVSVHVMIAELYLIGGEKLDQLLNTIAAQMQFTAAEAQKQN